MSDVTTVTAEEAAAPPRDRHFEAASQWQLMWWQFRRHRVAMVGLVVTLFIYLIAIFAGFLAPFDPLEANPRTVYQPPQIAAFHRHHQGRLELPSLRLHATA